MGLMVALWSSVHRKANSISPLIRRSGLTGWPRSPLSVLWDNRVALAPTAKAACHAAGRPIAPFTSTTTSTSLRTTDHLTIDYLEQMAAKLQSYMAALSFAEPAHRPTFLCLQTSATIVSPGVASFVSLSPLHFILFLPLSEQSLSTTELDAFLFNRYNRRGNGLEKSCEQFLVFASAMLESQ